jgi:branched-chain amino acid transport system ATP-binding protein
VFPTLTVAEHLRAAGWLYRDDPTYLAAANEEVLNTFPRLHERIDQMAGNLSGGEQQMLALGMAFIAKPKLLMIDELSLGLAPTIVEQLLEIVRRIQSDGTAIILVEQSINVALTVAERAYFLEKGEVRFEGPTSELLERDDIVRSVFLEGASTATGGKAKAKAATPAAAARVRPVLAEAEALLTVDGLVKRFGGIRAVDDTSFVLHRGEILGLIGPNGAGKTTIFDLVSGFLVPDVGKITLDGHDITTASPDARAWLGLGRSFQDARLVPSLTVAENVAIGLERHIDLRDHVAAVLNLPGIVRLEEDVAWTVSDLIELMNLGAFRDKFVRELSTGTRRIVDLAMCIAHDPKVLLLDEPSSGIAQRETEALGPLLERIQSETGCALLVIEHDMPLITAVSDRMIALELGHPIVEGTPDEVIHNPRVVSSYLGGDMAVINRSGAGSGNGKGNGSKGARARPKRTRPLRVRARAGSSS